MDRNTLIVVGLAVVTAGGILQVFVYPYLSGDIKADKRRAALRSSAPKRNLERIDANNRRKQVTDSLKEIDNRAKKKVTLEAKLGQAGLSWSRPVWYGFCAGCGVLIGGLVYLLAGDFIMAAIGIAVGALGFPIWVLKFLAKRRINKFINEFPAAVDIIIRGVKAGLPLGDCLRVVASESVEPVRTEFRLIVEAQSIGLSIDEACERIVERVPVAESNFFSIVINIQQKAGGNLSEALGNLSRVLRDRKKMKQKISAMSSEAKASAGIIGALPFVVTLFVYLTSPKYIELLWTTSTGKIVMAGCAVWMLAGIAVMRKMINFDF